MEFTESPEVAEFRTEVRSWMAENLPKLSWPEPPDLESKLPFWQTYQNMLFEAGYAGLTWSTEFGGQGIDERRASVFTEEAQNAGAPERLNTIGEDFAGPTIAHFGTQEQKDTHLRRILTGEDIWCQLFSEPESGSDLASLRTKAVKVEGGYRITGQKIWTSRAQLASYAILLARTGGGERHRGISYFILPMDAEGVTVRPLAHMLGEAEFNEVFLDEVFLPDSAVVGEVDGGWKVAMATLGFERVAIATGRVNTRQEIEALMGRIRQVRTSDGSSLGADPAVRGSVADLYGRVVVHTAISQRVITGAAGGEPPGEVTSIGKLYFCPLVDDLSDFALSLQPLGGQFDLDDEFAGVEEASTFDDSGPEGSVPADSEFGTDLASTDGPGRHWLRLANQGRGTAIAGGSTYIQRNIVSERILGMPKR